MKRLFWGICMILFLTGLSSCDYMEIVSVTNHTQDTILIGASRYNSIDSTMRFLESTTIDTFALRTGYNNMTKFNGKDKLLIGQHDLIAPDSVSRYGELNCPLFYPNQDQKGYFFVITLETARNHTWEEICRDTLYNKIVITQEMQKQGRHFDYWGKDSLSVRLDNNENSEFKGGTH